MWHKSNARQTQVSMLIVLIAWSGGAFAQPAPTQPVPVQPAPSQPAPPVAPVAPAPTPAPAEPAPSAVPPVAVEPAPEAAPAPAPAPLPAAELPPGPVEEAPAEAVHTEDGLPTDASLEPEPVTVTTSNEDEIVVTGTRIKRKTAFSAAAPVDVIDRKQLEYRGAATLSEVVQYLSVAQGSGFNGDAAGRGTASINLRGLGAGATLVLINGRRMHYSAGGIAEHFGDISTIPMAAVERIEILKGGASAIYGSDAVAGVVNVITRKDLDGAIFQLTGTTLQGGEQSGYTGSAAFGSTSERSRLLGSVQYGRTNELLASERYWSKDRFWSPFGNPPGVIAGIGTVASPECGNTDRSEVREVGSEGNTLCYYDQRDHASFMGAGERVNALLTAEHDVTDHTTIFAEVDVSRLRGDGSFYTFPIPAPYPTVPANHPDNPYGQDVALVFRPFDEANRNTADDDTFRGVLGLKGDLEGAAKDSFLEAWEWELAASFGISRYRNIIHDNDRQALQDALNSCSDPNNLDDCFNPFPSANTGGTPNSDVVRQRIQGAMENLTDHALQTYTGGVNGPIFELPGGDMAVALGAEVRHEWRSSEIDQLGNEFGYGYVLGNTDAFVSRDVYGAYLEARWPFFDGFELTTAGRGEQYTDMDNAFVSPSVGATWVPSETVGRDQTAPALRKLQLRVNGTRSFRAPTIYQSNPGKATVPSGVVLPGASSPTFIPVTYSGNPDLTYEAAWALSSGFSWQPIDELGLTSDFWYYNYANKIFQVTPTQILGQFAEDGTTPPLTSIELAEGSMDLMDISRINSSQVNVKDPIITTGLDFGVLFSMTGKTFGGNENDWGKLGIGATGTYTLSYTIPRERAAARILPSGDTLPPVDCEGDRCEVVGKRNDSTFAPPLPVLKVTFPVTYENSGHAIAIIPRLLTGVKDDAVPPMTGEQRDISPWTTVDVQYGYTIKEWFGEELTLQIGMNNAFDTPPPYTNPGTKLGATAFEPLLFDPRGRSFFGSAKAQF